MMKSDVKHLQRKKLVVQQLLCRGVVRQFGRVHHYRTLSNCIFSGGHGAEGHCRHLPGGSPTPLNLFEPPQGRQRSQGRWGVKRDRGDKGGRGDKGRQGRQER